MNVVYLLVGNDRRCLSGDARDQYEKELSTQGFCSQ